jgi:RND superfamily putative drug exporter
VAILIDASIVRMLLVPAAMEVMGRVNWWFPSWLNWLPNIHIDGNEVHTPEMPGNANDDKPDQAE